MDSSRTCLDGYTYTTKKDFSFKLCYVSTTVWLHYLDSNEMLGEKARWELHKNDVYHLEQSWKQNLKKTAVTSYLINHPRQRIYARHCWRSKDKLIIDVFPWTPTHGHTSVGQSAKNYIHRFCTDSGGVTKNDGQ